MTNTLTIPRELAETLVYLHETDQYMDIDINKLRALLAQADDADKVNNREMGLMQFVEKHAAPAVERQPIAEVQHGPFDDVGAPQWVRVVTLGDFDLEHIPDGTKLWASPPAPVAVVHTMKSVMSAICAINGFPMLTSNQCHALAQSLNKVKEMNRGQV